MFKIYFVGKDQIYSIVSEGGGKSMIRPNGAKILSFREYIDIFLLQWSLLLQTTFAKCFSVNRNLKNSNSAHGFSSANPPIKILSITLAISTLYGMLDKIKQNQS